MYRKNTATSVRGESARTRYPWRFRVRESTRNTLLPATSRCGGARRRRRGRVNSIARNFENTAAAASVVAKSASPDRPDSRNRIRRSPVVSPQSLRASPLPPPTSTRASTSNESRHHASSSFRPPPSPRPRAKKKYENTKIKCIGATVAKGQFISPDDSGMTTRVCTVETRSSFTPPGRRREESHERWPARPSVDDREYFCPRAVSTFRLAYSRDGEEGDDIYTNIYIHVCVCARVCTYGGPLIKAAARNGSPGYPGSGRRRAARFCHFWGGKFSVEIIDVARVIDELYPADRTHTYTRGMPRTCVRARACMRAGACVRACVCNRVHNVGGLCLVYRGGSSRRERRATASHWPPIGRSGGGSLQSSIQAVIG